MNQEIVDNRWLPPSPHREEVLRVIRIGRAHVEERGHNVPPLLIYEDGGTMELPRVRFAEVRKQLDVPIMADEAVHGVHDARLLLELGAVDIINIKLMKSSGIIGARRIADLAEQYGVPCQIGSMIESTVGTAMGAHAFLSHENIRTSELSGMRFLSRNYGEGVRLDRYSLALSEEPGLGVTVRDEELTGLK